MHLNILQQQASGQIQYGVTGTNEDQSVQAGWSQWNDLNANQKFCPDNFFCENIWIILIQGSCQHNF